MVKMKEGLREAVKSVKVRIIATIILILISTVAIVAAALSTGEVEIIADGQSKIVNTSEKDANVIIEGEGYVLGEDDELDLSEFNPDENEENRIRILRAVKVSVKDGSETMSVKAAGTVEKALKKLKIDINKNDIVKPALDTELYEGMQIEIQRVFTVKIVADGKTRSVAFNKGKVKDALKMAGIELGEDDKVSPALDKDLKPGDVVTVYRIEYRDRKATEVIKYKTTTKKTADLLSGQTRIEQKGRNGEQIVTYKDKIVDGKVTSSKLVDREVTKAAVNEIKLVGTKVKVLSTSSPISAKPLPSKYRLDADGIPSGIVHTITGMSNAYTTNTPAYRGNGGTASGVRAQSGYVAVNPRQIPYGTEMYIVSTNGKYVYGYCIAADTGGFANSGSAVVDLYMDTLSECYQWG
ncbi:MAG: ubiquitin-like domain-containing protein, partial [Oscillospiraceae bacterium]|nr:ubiquitin-like domain-containing protein [Oscillospiraceae bacterium]